jgi:hypothetical protein
MSMDEMADQSLTPIRTAIGDFMRYLIRELLPSVPWRAAALWGIALGAGFVIRGVDDILNPTTDSAFRSGWSSGAGLAICFCAGFQAAWRRRDFAHGGVVTLVAILIGFFVAIFGDVAAVLVISTFHKLDLAHELYWALEIPLPVMLLVGGSLGTVGAAIAVGLTRFRHRPAMQL